MWSAADHETLLLALAVAESQLLDQLVQGSVRALTGVTLEAPRIDQVDAAVQETGAVGRTHQGIHSEVEEIALTDIHVQQAMQAHAFTASASMFFRCSLSGSVMALPTEPL